MNPLALLEKELKTKEEEIRELHRQLQEHKNRKQLYIRIRLEVNLGFLTSKEVCYYNGNELEYQTREDNLRQQISSHPVGVLKINEEGLPTLGVEESTLLRSPVLGKLRTGNGREVLDHNQNERLLVDDTEMELFVVFGELIGSGQDTGFWVKISRGKYGIVRGVSVKFFDFNFPTGQECLGSQDERLTSFFGVFLGKFGYSKMVVGM